MLRRIVSAKYWLRERGGRYGRHALFSLKRRRGLAGAYTLRDCDVNCDGIVNVADPSTTLRTSRTTKMFDVYRSLGYRMV